MKRSALLPLLLFLPCAGCQRSDADKLARVGWKVTEKMQALVPARTPFGGALSLTKTQMVEERVRDRFKNDRFLAPTAVEISVEGSSVHLKGNVDDEVLKRRAVEIAESTVGVDNVEDEIVVAK